MVLVLPILIYDSIDHKYPGHLQCQIFALCGSISGIGAGATNAAIAYDRYRFNEYFNVTKVINEFNAKITYYYNKLKIIILK